MPRWNPFRLNPLSEAEQTTYVAWKNQHDMVHAVGYRIKRDGEVEIDIEERQTRLYCHVLLDLIPGEALCDVMQNLAIISNPLTNPKTYGLLEEPSTVTKRIGKVRIARRVERPVFSLDGE